MIEIQAMHLFAIMIYSFGAIMIVSAFWMKRDWAKTFGEDSEYNYPYVVMGIGVLAIFIGTIPHFGWLKII